MVVPAADSECGGLFAARFKTTHWSVVLASRDFASPAAREALETLCRTYWYPLYAYIRRQGYEASDAEDLTQAFFARFLAPGALGNVGPEKGKFRSFLLACLRHFLADERDRLAAMKRGGQYRFISLDAPSAEDRYRLEPADETNPEKIYERRWAWTLLEQARQCLRQEYLEAGKVDLYERLNLFETGESSPATYAEVAKRFGIAEGTVKWEASRLRRRFQQLVREVVARTVAHPGQIDDEIRYLIRILSS
jgi:RNA polymerase sigma-70 factor (ECF subfamily)